MWNWSELYGAYCIERGEVNNLTVEKLYEIALALESSPKELLP